MFSCINYTGKKREQRVGGAGEDGGGKDEDGPGGTVAS